MLVAIAVLGFVGFVFGMRALQGLILLGLVGLGLMVYSLEKQGEANIRRNQIEQAQAEADPFYLLSDRANEDPSKILAWLSPSECLSRPLSEQRLTATWTRRCAVPKSPEMQASLCQSRGQACPDEVREIARLLPLEDARRQRRVAAQVQAAQPAAKPAIKLSACTAAQADGSDPTPCDHTVPALPAGGPPCCWDEEPVPDAMAPGKPKDWEILPWPPGSADDLSQPSPAAQRLLKRLKKTS